MTEAEFQHLLDLIYETAVRPEAWEAVMERFADAVGGSGAWLSLVDVETNIAQGVITRIDPAMPALYAAHFAGRNPLANVPDPASYARGWTPKILTDEDWMPKADLVVSEYYNDFLRPQDIHSTLMIRLAMRGFNISVLNINRSERRGQFGPAQIDLASRLHPHLIRAFHLGERVSGLRVLSGGLADSLDQAPNALFLLGEDGAVRHANRRAAEMTGPGQSLAIWRGRLLAHGPEDVRRLDALIRRAASRDITRRQGGSMAIPRPGRRPLSVIFAPLVSEAIWQFMNGPCVLVCVSDLEATISLSERRLRDLFCLSEAEIRVAKALFDDLSPREAAQSLGLSFFTVRGHLARIYEKTQTRRQAELIRLLMRVAG